MHPKSNRRAQSKGPAKVVQFRQRNLVVMIIRAVRLGLVRGIGIVGGLRAELWIVDGDIIGISLVARKIAGLIQDQIVWIVDCGLEQLAVSLAVVTAKSL